MPEEKLVQVRCFRLSDAPNAKAPSKDEVAIERPVKSVGVPKVFQESKIKEMRMENLAMKKLKEKESQLRESLQAMKTDIEWSQPLELAIDLQLQDTAEEKRQQQRETQVFAVYYVKDHMIPPNPPELEAKTFDQPVDNQVFAVKLSKAFEEQRAAAKPEPEPGKSLDIALALNLLQSLAKNGAENGQWKKDLPKNYKTVPCKVYHGPMGHCGKGEFCHFIHDPSFVGREIPGELWRGRHVPKSYGPPTGTGWEPSVYPARPSVGFQPRSEMYIPPANGHPMDSPYMSREYSK